MLNFLTFTKYTFFQCKPPILFNCDLPRDLPKHRNLNFRQVLKGFVHILQTPAQLATAQGCLGPVPVTGCLAPVLVTGSLRPVPVAGCL